MNIIHAVFNDGGEYSDAYHILLRCFSTREKAETFVRELEEERDAQKRVSKMSEEHRIAWELANPNTVEYPEQEKYPRWHGIHNKDITQAMRDERAAIIARNEAANEAYSKHMDEYEDAWRNSLEAHLIMQNVPEKLVTWILDQGYWYDRHNRYVIQEVPYE